MKKTFLFMILCAAISIFGCSCNSSIIAMEDSTVVESDDSWHPAAGCRGRILWRRAKQVVRPISGSTL